MSKPSDFLIFGIHPVEEALSAGKTLDKVLIQQGVEGASLHALMQELRKRNIPYSQAPNRRWIGLPEKTTKVLLLLSALLSLWR